MVEWLSMLHCIQKAVVSVIGPETEWGVLIFLHPLQAIVGVVPKGTCKMEPGWSLID
jgi:hypothetical protein